MATILIDAEHMALAHENHLDNHDWQWHPKAICEFLRWHTDDQVDIARLRLLDPVNLLRTPYMDVSVEHEQVKVDIK